MPKHTLLTDEQRQQYRQQLVAGASYKLAQAGPIFMPAGQTLDGLCTEIRVRVEIDRRKRWLQDGQLPEVLMMGAQGHAAAIRDQQQKLDYQYSLSVAERQVLEMSFD